MKMLVNLCFLLVVSSFSRVASFEEGLTTGISIRRSEGRRYYDLYIPPNVTANPAILLSLHSSGSNKETQRGNSRWNEWADRDRNFVVAWPQGWGGNFNAGGYCCGSAGDEGIDDRLIDI